MFIFLIKMFENYAITIIFEHVHAQKQMKNYLNYVNHIYLVQSPSQPVSASKNCPLCSYSNTNSQFCDKTYISKLLQLAIIKC